MDQKKLTDLSTEDKQQLFTRLGECLAVNGINTTIDTYREVVCPLMGDSVDGNSRCSISKELKADQAELSAKVNKELKEIIGQVEGITVEIVAKLGAGDKYMTICDLEKVGEKDVPVSLEHKEGEVWLLDFWATWCPPCQAPMAHNQKMLEDNDEKWGPNLRIIGVSIDKDQDMVKAHVEMKGWGKVEHFWRAQSDCSKVYSV